MWNCTHFRHPTDEQLQHRYIFLATTIICSLSALNVFVRWIFSASYAIPFMISFGIKERDGIYDCLHCFLPLNSNPSLQISYLVTFYFLYYAPLLILTCGYLHSHLADVMETKDNWKRHRRKTQIIRIRKAKGYNAFYIICSCVCSSCYALYDKFSKYGSLS